MALQEEDINLRTIELSTVRIFASLCNLHKIIGIHKGGKVAVRVTQLERS